MASISRGEAAHSACLGEMMVAAPKCKLCEKPHWSWQNHEWGKDAPKPMITATDVADWFKELGVLPASKALIKECSVVSEPVVDMLSKFVASAESFPNAVPDLSGPIKTRPSRKARPRGAAAKPVLDEVGGVEISGSLRRAADGVMELEITVPVVEPAKRKAGRPGSGKPWEALGISRSVYFERKRAGTL